MEQLEVNYEEDVNIEENDLEIEWLEQPAHMLKYARVAATTRLNLDKAKEKLDFVKADLDKRIRLSPENYGVEKITETVVQNTIIMQQAYKDASNEVILKQFEMNVALGAVKAIESKKDALENLVRLLNLEYFSGPKSPRDISFQRKKRSDELKGRIGRNLSRT